MENPLLGQEPLPQFLKIRPEHVEPAVREVLTESRARIEALASLPMPKFATLVEPLLAGHVPDLRRHQANTSDVIGTRLVPATLHEGPTAYAGSAMLRGAVAADGLLVMQSDRVRWWPYPWISRI